MFAKEQNTEVREFHSFTNGSSCTLTGIAVSTASLSLAIKMLFTAKNDNKVGIKYGMSTFNIMYRGILVIFGNFVLSLVDESDKHWKFLYSYWNSSQSYVFTKGWSRFVKEKKLEADDVVFFQRQAVDSVHSCFLGVGGG
ncbi:hypothetical protein L1887_01719 [Cichorium endivia]|nr:hypothetical protein L1887_01719 [Cichorium endivia]